MAFVDHTDPTENDDNKINDYVSYMCVCVIRLLWPIFTNIKHFIANIDRVSNFVNLCPHRFRFVTFNIAVDFFFSVISSLVNRMHPSSESVAVSSLNT